MKHLVKARTSGFTLIELLVVVLIIGVLAAIALPKYQTAVDRSRYAALMPMAKSVASAQEAFYLANGNYSVDFGYLDVQLPNKSTGSIVTMDDGTTVSLSEYDEYDYVKLSKNNLENNYVIYQDKSPNYRSEIHCEAKEGSNRAERLCLSLGGQKIDGNLTPGYDLYILEGTGDGTPLSLALASSGSSEGKWQSCDTYPCTKTCTREMKAGYTCTGTYNEDHSYSEKVCLADLCMNTTYTDEDKYTKQIVCKMNGNVCEVQKELGYNEDGKMASYRACSAANSDGSCSAYSWGFDYLYDNDENKRIQRWCSSVNADGSCSGYSAGGLEEYLTEQGTRNGASKYCSSYKSDGSCSSYSSGSEYEYENGNQISYRSCSSYKSDGSCSSYSYGNDYGYDGNNHMTSSKTCSGFNNDGSCSTYSSVSEYKYETNGDKTFERYCSSWDNSGNCSAYKGNHDYTYEYDANGKKTSSTQRYCDSVNNDGSCITYKSGTDYTYDSMGNQKTARYCYNNYFNSDGSCKKYSDGNDFTYNSNGQVTTQRWCSASNMTNGDCSAYDSGRDYTYDENGNKISDRSCSSVKSDGSCAVYSSGTDYMYGPDGTTSATRSCKTWSGTTCTEWNAWSTTYY